MFCKVQANVNVTSNSYSLSNVTNVLVAVKKAC